MKKYYILLFSLCVAFSLSSLNCGKSSSGKKMTFLTIGTGAVTGVYYPTGGAISRMINKKADQYNIKATVESTAGSVYNVNAVLAGDLEGHLVPLRVRPGNELGDSVLHDQNQPDQSIVMGK